MYLADHDDLGDYLALPYTRLVAGLIRQHEPQIVLYGATTTGRDLAPRVASALRTGLTADCTDLRIGDFTAKGETYSDLLYQIRPAFGGNIIATIVSPEHRPQMATVREGVMVMPEADECRTGESSRCRWSARRPRSTPPTGIVLTDADFAVRLVKRVQEEKRVDLKGARIVVSGGVGVGSREGFALVEELARTLGGVVGASRAAVDAGWVEPRAPGRPDRHHGAPQALHRLRHQRLRAAPRRHGPERPHPGHQQRPAAPIFSVAHYGIVGDLHKVIPLLIQAYRTKA